MVRIPGGRHLTFYGHAETELDVIVIADFTIIKMFGSNDFLLYRKKVVGS